MGGGQGGKGRGGQAKGGRERKGTPKGLLTPHVRNPEKYPARNQRVKKLKQKPMKINVSLCFLYGMLSLHVV